MYEKLLLQLDAGRIKRYHTFTIQGEQTVAEHSYGVVQLVRAITDDRASGKLLRAALDHDVAELFTGDIPHTIKRKEDELSSAVKAIEDRINTNFQITYDLTEWEEKVLKLADLLEMAFFGLHQIKLGNGYAHTIVARVRGAMVDMHRLSANAETLIDVIREKHNECK